MVLFHRNLDVYRLALDFVEISADISRMLPRGNSYLCDQLKRSASSTVLNIGEGAGEFSKKEKIRFYRMALRSATESASTVDIIFRFKFIDNHLYSTTDKVLDRIVAMLTKLIHRHGVAGNGSTGNGKGRREPLRLERER